MHCRMLRIVISLGLLASVFATSAPAQEKAKAKGMIKARTGETLIVKTDDGNTTTVVLTDETTTKDDKGLFGLDKEIMSNAVLIPGLKVRVDGTSDDQGRIVAKTITVDGDDLETAEMIQSGLHPTAEQVSANMQAIEANRQGVAANKVELAAQKENIETNQKCSLNAGRLLDCRTEWHTFAFTREVAGFLAMRTWQTENAWLSNLQCPKRWPQSQRSWRWQPPSPDAAHGRCAGMPLVPSPQWKWRA